MINYINVIIMIASMLWYTIFYIISVGPARMEKKKGDKSYKICSRIRKISFVGMCVFLLAEIIYLFYPLNIGLSTRLFSGISGWIISIAIGLVISIAATILMRAAVAVANDSITTRKENGMYGGIYQKIRHPQAIGDVSYWIALAFFFNSPFLILINLLWIPLNYIIAKYEEKDLKLRFGQNYVDYMKTTGMFIPKRK
ncbi:MAG: methyltransferase [Spirochaetales bacterium]|nr:methyltransferase [Spirochaetales bacterium]